MPTFGDVHLLNITDLKIWGNFFNAKIYKDFFRCKIYEDVLRINSKFTFLGPDSIVKLRIDNFSHCENCCCVQSGRAARVSRLTFPNILTRDLFTPWKNAVLLILPTQISRISTICFCFESESFSNEDFHERNTF